MKLHNSFMCLETSYTFQNIQNSFFFLFFFFFFGGGGGGRLGAELREIEKAGLVNLLFSDTCKENSVMILNIGT